MPNWKKVVVSGSSAHLNHVTASGNVSGSLTSTGSFGHLSIAGETSASGQVNINTSFAQLRLSDDGFNDFLRIGQSGPVGYIKTSDGDNNFKFRRGNDNTDLLEIYFADERIHISGSGGLDVTGHVTASGNVSASSTSTASFGTYFGDGGNLTGIDTGLSVDTLERGIVTGDGTFIGMKFITSATDGEVILAEEF